NRARARGAAVGASSAVPRSAGGPPKLSACGSQLAPNAGMSDEFPFTTPGATYHRTVEVGRPDAAGRRPALVFCHQVGDGGRGAGRCTMIHAASRAVVAGVGPETATTVLDVAAAEARR